MRKVILGVAILALAFASLADASVETVTFGDGAPSWGTGFDGKDFNGVAYGHKDFAAWQPPPNSGTNPTVDELGDPMLRVNDSTSGQNEASFTVSGMNQTLDSITIRYNNNGGGWWETIKPGDLFLDIDGEYGFDIVARTEFFASTSYDTATLAAADTWDLYGLSNLEYLRDMDDDTPGDPGGPYQLADNAARADTGAGWSGFLIRDYHPWALDSVSGLTKVGEANFSGWQDLDGVNTIGGIPGESTWTFDMDLDADGAQGISIEPTSGITIGWTVNCANDVLLSEIASPLSTVIPEPSTLIIWSLIGLSFGSGMSMVRRRKALRGGRGRWSAESRDAIRGIIERGHRS